MIRAVLFDFYDTLGFLESEPLTQMRREQARRAGADEIAFFDALRATFEARTLGTLGPPEHELAAVFAQLQLPVSQGLVAELAALERHTWCASVQFYPDARPTLLDLRARGLKLALVSNCSAPAAAAIHELRTADLLDTLVLSCEVGLKKPDPAIYLLACERLAVQPAECAFVGDGGSHELEAAHALGMLTVYVNRPEHTTDFSGIQPFHHRLATLHQVVDVLPA